MLKRLSLIATPVVSALFLNACGDPNMPAERIVVPNPAWTQGLRLDVRKLRCSVTTPDGRTLTVEPGGTDLGNNLRATRRILHCTVTNQTDGTTCTWGTSYGSQGTCSRENPAYRAYRAGH